MTDKEIQERIAQDRDVCKAAEQSIRDMKIKLSKYTGDKTKQQEHLKNLENLLNLAVKQTVDMDDLHIKNARLMVNIGALSYDLNKMKERYYISEKINERGVDDVVDEYLEIISKKIKDKNI